VETLWPAIALHGLMNFWWDLTKENMQLVFRRRPVGRAGGFNRGRSR
jgi:hypothetical protein